MIGRAAELARREDDHGRPLPTSDLMGYEPLGIVFGPILLGEMLDYYTIRFANPHGGLVVLPISPPKPRKDRHKKSSRASDEGVTFHQHIDKIKIANGVTEMLITHWRDIVRMMKDLKDPNKFGVRRALVVRPSKKPLLRPSASESFILRKPPAWENSEDNEQIMEQSGSPTPLPQRTENLVVKKQRSRTRPHKLSGSRMIELLSPTVEEQSPNKPSPGAARSVKSSQVMNLFAHIKTGSPIRRTSQRLTSQKSISLLAPTMEERSSAESVCIIHFLASLPSKYSNLNETPLIIR